jgi:hypothetical protein
MSHYAWPSCYIFNHENRPQTGAASGSAGLEQQKPHNEEAEEKD